MGSHQFNYRAYTAGQGLYQVAWDEGYAKGYKTADEYDVEQNPYMPGTSEHEMFAIGYEEGWLDS